MRIKIIRKDISTFLELIVLLLGFIIIAFIASYGTVGLFISMLIFGFVVFVQIHKCQHKKEMTVVLISPIMLSAFQNVYLGMFSPRMNSITVQLLTILNFLFAAIIFVVLFINNNNQIQNNNLSFSFALLVLYSVFSVVLLKNMNIISIISSFRNIISIFLFFFIGVMSANRLNIERFQKMLMVLGFTVVLIGFVDVATQGTMWRMLNITDLWTKKGIHVQASGLPTSFYSSEKINGQRILRMASTFADPVNLGAFLFAVLGVSWFRKSKSMVMLSAVAIVFTVSKGAFLGILLFLCVYSYYHFSKPVFLITVFVTATVGIAFLLFASRTSANSVFAHVSGLLAAFKSLFSHPLGFGIGSNGVLAAQFSGYYANEEIQETGLGMIIGQLGFPGLLIYVYFFWVLIKTCMRIEDKREKILCLSLTLSIIANMFFNEVALSPNSSAIYFLIIGYYVYIANNGVLTKRKRIFYGQN